MLVDKNKSISFLWDLNFFHSNETNFFYYSLTNMLASLPHGCKPGLRLYAVRFQVVGYKKMLVDWELNGYEILWLYESSYESSLGSCS